MTTVLNWPESTGMLILHDQNSFSRNDTINIPAGKAAILSVDGKYSDVWREGDRPALGKSIFRKKADLYLFDLTPSEAVEWGIGGVSCGARVCGVNGSIRLQIVSPVKFLIHYAYLPLPLTAAKIVSLRINRIEATIRHQIQILNDAGVSETKLPQKTAQNTVSVLSDLFEEEGLQIFELNINPLFFPDPADGEE